MGIDYGMGKTNIDLATGIRYGVISQNLVSGDALNDMEPDYGLPHCPKCGNEAVDYATLSAGDVMTKLLSVPGSHEEWDQAKYESPDFACPNCEYIFGSESAYPDESIGQFLDNDEYKIVDCLDSDLMVILSPYWTFANFCFPCVPGAGNLDSWLDSVQADCRAYCLGHDWFEDGVAPYPVYRVSDNSVVEPD